MGFDPARAQLASDYMRIASMTLWAFEVLQTIPSEYRIYRKAIRTGKFPLGCRLFVAVRYLGTLAMIASAVGFFGRGYSHDFCVRYQRVAPLTKVASGLANQAVFLWRTYAISGRKKWVLRTLGVVYLCVMVLQIFANSTTVPASSSGFGNCLAGARPGFRVSWVYYLAAILYDFLVLGISYYFLAGFAGVSWTEMYTFTRSLLAEGVLYVMLATFINIVNLIFFELPVSTTVQGMFATMGIAVTSLASQRIMLHLIDPVDGRPTYSSHTTVHSEPHYATRTIGGSNIRGGRSNQMSDASHQTVEMDRMQVQVQIEVEHEQDSDSSKKRGHMFV